MQHKTKITLVAVAGLVAASGIAFAAKGYRDHSEFRAMFSPGKMLERVDTNDDNAASREELFAFAAERFATADTNQDGRVSKAEIISAIEASELPGKIKRHSGRMADRLANSSDINQDGVLEVAEIENRLGKFHALADWNDDGKVEMAEAKRLRSTIGRGGRKHHRE